jgi:hypothetical protein
MQLNVLTARDIYAAHKMYARILRETKSLEIQINCARDFLVQGRKLIFSPLFTIIEQLMKLN